MARRKFEPTAHLFLSVRTLCYVGGDSYYPVTEVMKV